MGAFVIKGGEIYDPAAQKWEKKDIAIENGMIISGMPSGEYQVVDASGCKVTTGWIDYHVHYFNHGTENGINPDAASFPCGVTTAVDGGSTGAANYEMYRKSAMAYSDVRILNMLLVGSGGQVTDRYPEHLEKKYFDIPKIKKLFREGGTVKVSRSLKELGLRVNAAREHHRKLCGTEPTLSQLAEELGESVENITLAIQAAQPALSLTPEGENNDRQIDIPVESPEEELADKIGLAEVLESLPEEDRLLIRLRFYANRTQSETAKVLHTTQVQISRRERKILRKMRERLLE